MQGSRGSNDRSNSFTVSPPLAANRLFIESIFSFDNLDEWESESEVVGGVILHFVFLF